MTRFVRKPDRAVRIGGDPAEEKDMKSTTLSALPILVWMTSVSVSNGYLILVVILAWFAFFAGEGEPSPARQRSTKAI
jgi:hypothetical protein